MVFPRATRQAFALLPFALLPFALLPFALLPLALFGPTAFAQSASEETPKIFSETIEVEVVNVEVTVTDKSGHPISGLAASDFELYEEGREVEVSNFFAVEGGRRVLEESLSLQSGLDPSSDLSAASEREPNFIVVYVDNAHIIPFSRNRLFTQLRDFVKDRTAKGDQILLASSEAQFAIQHPFSNDLKGLTKTLDRLEEAPATGVNVETERRRVLQDLVYLNDTLRVSDNDPCEIELPKLARDYGEAVFAGTKRTLGTLRDFVSSLSGLPGRKTLVHVSDGLPMLSGLEAFEMVYQLCGGGASAEGINTDTATESGPNRFIHIGIGASLPAESVLLDAQGFSASDLLQEVVREANSNQVSFYPFQARGPQGVAGRSAESGDVRMGSMRMSFALRSNLQDPLTMIAADTGGRAILNTADFKPVFQRLDQALDTYYSLGYTVERAQDGKVRRLNVKVPGKNLQVRHRNSHRGRPAEEVLSSRTLGALLYGGEDNPLEIALEVGNPSPLDESLYVVPVRVRIPLRMVSLIPGDEQHRGLLRLHVGARDRSARLAPVRTAEIPINIPASQVEVAQTKDYLYEVKMLMREGDHTVAVGVRDENAAVASYLLEEVPVFKR